MDAPGGDRSVDLVSRHPGGKVVGTVPVEIADCQSGGESVTAVIVPEESIGGDCAAVAAEENVGCAVARSAANIFVGNANEQVIVPVGVEISGGQRQPKQVALLRQAVSRAAAVGNLRLPPDLGAGGTQPGGVVGGAVKHVDRSGVVGDDVLIRRADSQVVAAISVEIPGGQRPPEFVPALGETLSRPALGPSLRPIHAQPIAPAAVEHSHGPGGIEIARILGFQRHANSQVVVAVGVEIARGQSKTEIIIGLGRKTDSGQVLLGEELGPIGRERSRRAVQDDDRAGVGDGSAGGLHIFDRDADGQVVERIAVEIAHRQHLPKGIPFLCGGHAGVALLPKLAVEVRQADRGVVDDVDRSGILNDLQAVPGFNVLAGDAHGGIHKAVAVEIPGCQGLGKVVVGFDSVRNVRLNPQGAGGGIQVAPLDAIQHVERTGVGDGADIFVRSADEQGVSGQAALRSALPRRKPDRCNQERSAQYHGQNNEEAFDRHDVPPKEHGTRNER